MIPAPKVSVIILNWNGTHLLRRYLPSVVEFTDPTLADVIVADNGSTDESLRVLADEFPSVHVIALDRNYGFAEGYNRAIARVATPYVVLLNDDVAVPRGWLEPLIEYMDAHAECAACQPKLLSDRDHSRFEYAGAAGGYLDRMGYPYCRGRIFACVETDCGQYDTVRRIMWATGACYVVRRDLYVEAGGLDPRFFAHMEEIDLSWRLRSAGHTLVCVPSSTVYHLGGASLDATNPRKTMLNFRNSLLMLWKNLPTSRRRAVIRRRKVLDALAALNFLLHGQWSHVRAVWQAHREAAQMIRDHYSTTPAAPSSSTCQASSVATAEFPESQLSILWQHFVRRRRTFDTLPF